jgi:alpha-methylacyl-CoA racemase
VLLEGFRPGVAERLGLGPLDVQRVNPRLIYARLTGWGQTGPLSQTVGHDINYVALSGVLSLLGHPGERPRPPMNLLGDYAGGGLVAALGIVSALFETARSGQGQVIDAAMLDGAALVNAKTHSLRTLPSWSDQPGTNFIDGGAPFYDTYETRDGKYVAVGAIEPDFFRAFLSGLGVDTSSWPEQSDRQSWPKLRRLIADVVVTRTRDEWAQRYEHSDGCLTPVLTLDEAAAHPHIVDRATYVRRQGVLQPAPAPRFSRTPTAIADGEPA